MTITLHCTEGGADKIYRVFLSPAGSALYTVDFEYGRRGGSLKAGTKTPEPLPLEEAQKVFDKLVASKIRGGYVPKDGAAAAAVMAVGSERAGRDSGLRPQLLTAVDRGQAALLVADPAYLMQPKHDGERRILAISADGTVVGVNRSGLEVAIPVTIAQAAGALASDAGRTVLDGEQIGEHYVAFDLLEDAGQDLRDLGAAERFARLVARVPAANDEATFFRTSCWHTPEGRPTAFDALATNGAEGAVFKRASAPYRAIRDPDAIKVKFVETLSARVIAGRAGKRSIGLELMDQATAIWRCVGNVTVPANLEIPAAGAIVEVAYLYCSGVGGALIQPVLRGARNDVGPEACALDQLKYKTAAEDLAA